jgi:hypothetical protein
MPLEMKSNWFVLDLSHAQYYIFSVFHCASNTIAREFQFFVAHSTFRFVVCLLIDNAQGDLFLEPQIYGGIKRFGIDMTNYPTLARLHEAYMEHPAFQAALPERQPDAPSSPEI